MCDNKIIIDKAIDNVLEFVVKSSTSTLPVQFQGTDVFTAKFINLSDLSDDLVKQVTISNPSQGKLKLSLSKAEVNSLDYDRGDKVDRYYSTPTYKLIISGNTASEGNIVIKIPYIYIE